MRPIVDSTIKLHVGNKWYLLPNVTGEWDMVVGWHAFNYPLPVFRNPFQRDLPAHELVNCYCQQLIAEMQAHSVLFVNMAMHATQMKMPDVPLLPNRGLVSLFPIYDEDIEVEVEHLAHDYVIQNRHRASGARVWRRAAVRGGPRPGEAHPLWRGD